MKKITKCLNEWNAIVEALGKGKQSILIRRYSTNHNEFILYPTLNYTIKDNFLDNFKSEYKQFAKENALPKTHGKKKEIKYYAKIEKILTISPQRIGTLDNYHIWTKEQVKSYLNNQKAFVWVLRVYKIKPKMAERTMGMKYSNLKNPITLDKMEPIINDSDFSIILKELEQKK